MQTRNSRWQYVNLCLLMAVVISMLAMPPGWANPNDNSGQTNTQDASSGCGPDNDDPQSTAATGTDVDVTAKSSTAVLGTGVQQPGVSLFTIVRDLFRNGVLLVLLFGLIMSFKLLLCATVWHTTKLLHGGNKPAVG